MAIRPTLGWNNRLVQRVMRHRSVTTLFPAVPAGTAWPPGTAWPAGSMSGAARSDRAATTDSGYVAVVIDPPTNSAFANSEFATAEAAVPEVRVSQSWAATPTRVPLGGPAHIVRPAGPAPTGSAPQPRTPTAVRTTSVTPQAPAGQTVPSVVAARAAAESSPQPDQAQRALTPPPPSQGPSTSAVDNAGDTTITDHVWRRLQTIFRRHQAPELAEPEATAAAEVPSPGARATEDTTVGPQAKTSTQAVATGAPGGPVQRTPDTAVAAQATPVTNSIAGTTARATARPGIEAFQSSAPRQERLPRITELEPTSEPEVTDTEVGSPEEVGVEIQITPAASEALPLVPLDRATVPPAQPSPQHVEAARSARPAPAARGTAIEPPAPPVAADLADLAQLTPGGLGGPRALPEARPTPPSAPIERADAPARPTPPEQVGMQEQPAPGRPRPLPATEIRLSAPDATVRAIATSPAATPQISSPLQDVWAVQRLPEPVGTVSGPVANPVVDRARQAPQTRTESSPDEVAEILDRVSAGRPTRSAIEMILPRRPRPPQRPSATFLAETVAPPEVAVPALEKARSTVSAAGATTAPPAPPGRQPEGSDQAASEARVVRFNDMLDADRPRSVQTVTPPVVETEIGALPADLWQLIGETPPAPRAIPRSFPVAPHAPTTVPAPVPVARKQPSGPALTLQRSTISTTAQAPASATATQHVSPVRSGTQQAPAPEPAASEPGTAAAPDTESTGEPAVDVDKLAHRVYADIKRRLTVEWERIRRL